VFVVRYGWEGGNVKEGGDFFPVRWERCYGG